MPSYSSVSCSVSVPSWSYNLTSSCPSNVSILCSVSPGGLIREWALAVLQRAACIRWDGGLKRRDLSSEIGAAFLLWFLSWSSCIFLLFCHYHQHVYWQWLAWMYFGIMLPAVTVVVTGFWLWAFDWNEIRTIQYSLKRRIVCGDSVDLMLYGLKCRFIPSGSLALDNSVGLSRRVLPFWLTV